MDNILFERKEGFTSNVHLIEQKTLSASKIKPVAMKILVRKVGTSLFEGVCPACAADPDICHLNRFTRLGLQTSKCHRTGQHVDVIQE